MDVLFLLMGLALAAAGWLLFRDYTRSLHGTYTARGKVVGIESGYCFSYGLGRRIPSFLPVIEYYWNGESAQFTALSPELVGTVQIGDQLSIQVSRSRRRRSRLGRALLVSLCPLTGLALVLLAGATQGGEGIDLSRFGLACLVLTVCFFIIVLYCRQLDESLPGDLPPGGTAARIRLCLQEPTAPRHWCRYRLARRQRARILYSRLLGGSCLAGGIVLMLAAFQNPGADWPASAQKGILDIKRSLSGYLTAGPEATLLR